MNWLTPTIPGPRIIPAVALAGALLLGGCAGTDHVAPPAELTAIDAQFAPVVEWSADVGAAQPSRLSRLIAERVEDRIYTVDPDGRIQERDARTGALRHEVELDLDGESVVSGIAASEDLLVVGTSDGRVLAIEPGGSTPRWEATLTTAAAAPAVIAGGQVIVRAGDGRIFALDEADGRRVWVDGRKVPPLALQGQSRPLAGVDAVIVGHDNGLLVAHALDDGRVLWENQIALPRGRTDIDRMVDIDARPLFLDGIVYALAFQGNLAAIDVRSGRTLWSRELSGFDNFTGDAQALYITDAEGVIHAIDRRSGDKYWQQDALNNRFLTGPVRIGAWLAVADFEGYVHFLSPETGALVARVRTKARDVVSPLVGDDKALYVLGRDGTLVRVGLP
ncbi:MAG: outer membrane protein assembly factor BamB [Halothiobacillaceae bacterium]